MMVELFSLEEIYSHLHPEDTSQSYSTEESYNFTATKKTAFQYTSYILDHYISPVICGFGCLGNIINLIVLARMKMMKIDGGRENGAQIGLFSLALSDMLFCLILFPRGFVPSQRAVFEEGFRLYYQAYGTWLVTTFILTSTWVTVVIASLRYVAICHPLFSRRVDRPLCAKIAYTAVFVMCIVFNLPSLWQYQISVYQEDLFILDIGALDLTKSSGKVYTWIKAFFGMFIPAVILIFCNVSLIIALRRSQRMRRGCYVKKDSTIGRRNRVTAMLIIIAMGFVILVFPSELLDFCHGLIPRNDESLQVVLITRSITNTLQVINFSFNFAIYCTLNVHFRDVLRHLVCLSSRRTPDHLPSELDRQWVRFTRVTANGSSKTCVSAV